MKVPDYDNADLAIVTLLLLGIAAITLGGVEDGVLSAIIAGVIAIAKIGSDKST